MRLKILGVLTLIITFVFFLYQLYIWGSVVRVRSGTYAEVYIFIGLCLLQIVFGIISMRVVWKNKREEIPSEDDSIIDREFSDNETVLVLELWPKIVGWICTISFILIACGLLTAFIFNAINAPSIRITTIFKTIIPVLLILILLIYYNMSVLLIRRRKK